MLNLLKIKTFQIVITLGLLILAVSCGKNSNENISVNEAEIFEPHINFDVLNPDFKKWWTYHYYNISLSADFIGITEQLDTISKKQFLEKLTSGSYLPLRLKSEEGLETYKLFKLDNSADESIGSTIKDESLLFLKQFELEGKPFVSFSFTDLKGNRYTNESTRGKTLILKTWFIGCTACIAEFPELNELVKKHELRNDMVFVSLALDSKTKLEEFLSKKDFDYEVVPEQGKFITKELKFNTYPTHIVIDENGIILKVVNKASEMISFLNSHEKLTNKSLPPPPPPM